MPPEIAVRISCSVGSGFSFSSARAVISIPGVQKPHCSACISWKPCWIGSSRPSRSSDSTVSTAWPSHITARVVQDFTARPSTCTTQAPQLDVSQPQWVPVRSSVSRRKCTSSMRGSMSCVTRSPLTVIVTLMSGLLLHGALDGAAKGSLGEDAGEMALVVDRPAAVVHRGAVGGGDFAGLHEEIVREPLAAQELLRPLQVDGGEADRAERDADLADDAVRDPDGGRGGRDRPVPGSPLHLLVGAAAAGA